MKNWIDRYVYAVVKKLPKKERDNVELVLRSTIDDALKEETNDREPAEKDIFHVLEMLGKPSEVAAKYGSETRYLIGPELYEIYLMVVGFAIMGVSIGLFVAFLVSTINATVSFGLIFLDMLGTIVATAISIVGSVTIVFAIIQRFMPEEWRLDHGTSGEAWDPKELPVLPKPKDEFKLSEPIVGICFMVLALIVFNLFPDKIAIYEYKDSVWISEPIFNLQVLKSYMPYINSFWVAAILFNMYLIKSGKWNRMNRTLKVMLNIIGLGLFILIVSNPEILNREGIYGATEGLEGAWSVLDIVIFPIRIAIVVIIVVSIIDIIRNIVKIVKDKQ